MAGAIEHTRVAGTTIYRCQLTESAVATENGEWIDVRGLGPFSIHVSGITTATVQIRGSNDDTKPADATHDIQLGTDITADSIYEYSVPIKWIKSRVSSWTSGTIIVELEARTRA